MECYIDDTLIYYEEYGVGKPLLCLHGFPEDHNAMLGCIEPVFQHLTGYRRIYVDLPGMGKSQVSSQIKNADNMLDVIICFISKVIGDESFLLIGQSYGGYLTLGLLLRLPQKIDGVFLLCPCIVADKQDRNLPLKQVVFEDEDVIFDNNEDDFSDFKEFGVVINQYTWLRYKSEILSGLHVADISFIENYQKQGYHLSFESEFKNINYNKPSCIITGRQDNCVGFMNALELINNFTRATFAVLDGAGHNLQIERVALFNAYVEDWIKRVSY